ncbi:hypothetical protein PAXRUDRAFT_448671 [Paxillus rubicundulus Ve08.2h10]|uniref:Uncharacterized protein n=1 Tax=Paxillus rubicundulus Ve08.2h10 TaxID=930991 RepID=A0A0D0E1Y9_9AGAM|nr:hypothetical protein PAXRUDRAFT_448671 [Paxillus rubicundulus Ve08.2h10]
MPPRRSTRSTRPSVEPQPAPASSVPPSRPTSSKRKRVQSVAVDETDGEKENATKRRLVRRSVKEEPEEEEEKGPQPTRRTRHSSAKPAPSKTSTNTNTRSSRKTTRIESDVEEEAGEEEEEEEDKGAAVAISDDGDSDDALPTPKGKGRKPASGKRTNKQPKATRKASSSKTLKNTEPSDLEEEDDLEGFDQIYKSTPRRAKRAGANNNSSPSQPSQTPKRAAPVDEEERSLLEPRARPPTQSQPPPVEEPNVLKARLVIHKMALVNFKSYAGRQEIGPFHKVRIQSSNLNVCRVEHRSILISRSRLSLVPTAQESRIRSTRFCSCLGIAHRKCVKENFLS